MSGSGASSMRILTLNSGSSSLKAGLYQMADTETLLLSVIIEGIGRADARMRVGGTGDRSLLVRNTDLSDHNAALTALVEWISNQHLDRDLDAIGHRIVYGGSGFFRPQRVTPDLVAMLRTLIPRDPDHLPQVCANIETMTRLYPHVSQMASFDTAFHRHMPRVAQQYALPRRFTEAGIVRLGFHGLSYEYVMQALHALDPVAADGKVVIAHLGSGASMAAIRGGKSIDTSMGFTPLSGLVMGTRCGDLDPGVVLYLFGEEKMDVIAVNNLLNQQSGLRGISATSNDMRELLDREMTDPHAAEAIESFCYQARKFVGAYAAALGGLDTLIFTAGIGERSATVRARICAELAFLGVTLDGARNKGHAPVISCDGARVTVRIIPTDEDRMIARHTRNILEKNEGVSYAGI